MKITRNRSRGGNGSGGHSRYRGDPRRFASSVLTLWLRGDMGVTLNSGNVSAWADQGPSGNSVNQGTAGKQPIWIASEPSLHGKASVQFVKADSKTLTRSATDLVSSGAYTIFMLIKVDAVTAGDVFLDQAAATGLYLRIFGTSRCVTHLGFEDHTDAAQATGAYELWTVQRALSEAPTLRINGASTELTSVTTTFTPQGANILAIGSDSDVANYADMRLAEMVVFNTSVSASARTRLEHYIGARYGRAL